MGNQSSSEQMTTALINLRMASKQMAREAKRCEKRSKAERAKIKQAISAGDKEVARVHAENAIRQDKMRTNYIRLSSRVEAAASRVDTAIRMQQVTKAMGSVVRGMDRAMQTMDLEKIGAVMDQFEKQFEDLDVNIAYTEDRIGVATSLSTPVDEVDSLINQVADEYGLDVQTALGITPTAVPTATAEPAKDVSTRDEEILERLGALQLPSS